MLRSEGFWFLRLGSVIERADNTGAACSTSNTTSSSPKGEQVGGALDRDQWTTILHTVSAANRLPSHLSRRS
jgi:uncharacterized alpha-E superfamily protein